MLTKTLFGLAVDLLRLVISAMAEMTQLMMMWDFGTIWVSDLTHRPTEAQHVDTHYPSRREIDESDDLAGDKKTEPEREFIAMKERSGIVLAYGVFGLSSSALRMIDFVSRMYSLI